MNKLIFVLTLFCWMAAAQAKLVGEEVKYREGDTLLLGYLAYDDAIEAPRPGILVVHEWWGHNEYARDRAKQLAQKGYTALAVDMYGEGKQANHPKEAGRFAGELKANMELATARFQAALAVLQAHHTVAKQDISAIGYCFGGGIVLEMARRGVDLDLVASFHGSLVASTPAKKGAIKAQIMAFNGADDPLVTPEQIESFKAEMEAAGADYSFTNYIGAKHSFTNSAADELAAKFALPLAYNLAADMQSWASLGGALEDIYAGK